MPNEERIVIRNMSKPQKENVDALVDWFCQVFDLSGKNDEIEPAMFREIVTNSFNGEGTTSKALNKKLDMPRSTVIYHLNRFMHSGLVVRKSTRYYLRSEDMVSTIEELQADMMREFNRLMEFAEKMDQIFENDTYGRRKEKRK